MNYPQALALTHSFKRLGSTPGLACIVRVMEKLGNPQNTLQCIHVAGTNGKGSVCAMTASVLQAAGYKTGLFISPYLVEFRERFQVNGKMISEETYARLAKKVKTAMDETGEELSQFAFITAVAFCYFAEQQCDVVVLETGLGGRLDATNIIPHPLVTAITAIGLDHTELLGNTLEQIAAEKCGIMKQGTPTVLSGGQSPRVAAVVMEQAARLGIPLIQPNPAAVTVTQSKPGCTRFTYGGEEYALSLSGTYQPQNAATAIEILQAVRVKLPVSAQAIHAGLAAAVHPGRCQVLRADPLILLDGAHNPQGAAALAGTLTDFLGQQKAVGVCGVMSDKAAEQLARQIGPHLAQLIAVAPNNPRALPAGRVAELFATYCPTAIASVDETLGKKLWAQSRPAVIFGSLYLAGEFLQKQNSEVENNE